MAFGGRSQQQRRCPQCDLALREFSPRWSLLQHTLVSRASGGQQREFMAAAQTYVARGAGILSDAIERTLEDVSDRAPGGSEVRPLIASTCRYRSRAPSMTLWKGTPAFAIRAGPQDLNPARRSLGLASFPVTWARRSRTARGAARKDNLLQKKESAGDSRDLPYSKLPLGGPPQLAFPRQLSAETLRRVQGNCH